ncbi:transposase [Bifidobacterium pseudocatenulatum]|uniref:transposase n=1 Tax=Bifidobacterium pseudocatenulatum TaxID=28026 RepID=UPI003857D5E2
MFRQRPQAERILDGFHIVSRATDALDKVRTEARRSGTPAKASGTRSRAPGGRC